jgi:uncharacterized protein YkwD
MSRSATATSMRPLALLVLVATLLAAPATAFALDTASRDGAAIYSRYQQLKPTYSGSPYTVAPSTRAPYATGALAPGFAADGMNAVNYTRFLAGLPDDVTWDAGLADRAQHGAVLLAASTFSHTPPKPADMADSFYQIGLGSTSRSNIGYGYPSLAAFNADCADDTDSYNIDRLGHRRWLLNPPMGKTGMGYASNRADTFVFDESRAAPVDYDTVLYPCAGLFPVEMLSSTTAWSISLNPARYRWTAGAQSVTMRRLRDGRTWTFTAQDKDTSGKYFNFETSGYGEGPCAIFRPDPASVGSYAVGDAFDITLSGGIWLRGTETPATISYRTELLSQAQAPAPGTPGATPPAQPAVRAAAAAPVGRTPTAITIGATPARVSLPKTFVLSGRLTPGRRNDPCAVEVRKPGSTRWSYSSARLAHTDAGEWWYRYAPKKRGAYTFRVRFGGDSTRAPSVSRTIGVTVR